MKICSIDKCNRKHHGKGLCNIHLHKSNRLQNPEPPEKAVWFTMKSRCYNKNNKKYANYGGRGITVCERWLGSFDKFLQDMGPRPEHGTLERMNVNGDYEPSNCRWATQKEQQNNRRNNVFITLNGATHTLVEWCTIKGLNYGTVWNRLKVQHKSPEEALI